MQIREGMLHFSAVNRPTGNAAGMHGTDPTNHPEPPRGNQVKTTTPLGDEASTWNRAA